MLTGKKDPLIIKTSGIYKRYRALMNHESGLCFGASLYWSSELLRYAGKNNKLHKMSIADVHKLRMQDNFLKNHYYLNAQNTVLNDASRLEMQTAFLNAANSANKLDFPLYEVRQFYDFSNLLQKSYESYERSELGIIDRKEEIARTLNAQENYLSSIDNYNSEKENKLLYTVCDARQAKNTINSMLSNPATYENKALILSTRLLANVPEEESFIHASVIINYERRIYFFDVNTGIYSLPANEGFTLNYELLLYTVARNFRLTQPYYLNPLPIHILVETTDL